MPVLPLAVTLLLKSLQFLIFRYEKNTSLAERESVIRQLRWHMIPFLAYLSSEIHSLNCLSMDLSHSLGQVSA